MYLMGDEIVLDAREMDEDIEVRVQAGRFQCVPGARHTQGFAVAVIRTFPDEPAILEESTVFEPGDVFNVPLYVAQDLRAKFERVLLETCFGVFAYATYLFFNPGADLGFPILVTIARAGDGYALTMGDQVSVPFKTLEELRAMLPPLGAEGERGYEDARASLIEQFVRATP